MTDAYLCGDKIISLVIYVTCKLTHTLNPKPKHTLIHGCQVSWGGRQVWWLCSLFSVSLNCSECQAYLHRKAWLWKYAAKVPPSEAGKQDLIYWGLTTRHIYIYIYLYSIYVYTEGPQHWEGPWGRIPSSPSSLKSVDPQYNYNHTVTVLCGFYRWGIKKYDTFWLIKIHTTHLLIKNK